MGQSNNDDNDVDAYFFLEENLSGAQTSGHVEKPNSSS